jgi:hypothetical protein
MATVNVDNRVEVSTDSRNTTPSGPGTLTIVSAPGSVTEGTDRTLKVTLKFDAVSSVDSLISVKLASGSTATTGVDVPVGEATDRVKANLSPAGPYSYVFNAFPILDDAIPEPTKTLSFTVTAPGLTFQNGSNSITINVSLLDDDGPNAAPNTGPGIGVDPQLGTAMQNILRAPPTSSAAADLAYGLSARLGSGGLTQAQALAEVVKAADATTSVATLNYQFFTGKLPSQAGLDYLVSPIGPNANNLNSAYYQGFNLENRYINFAVNLGKMGEGRTAFEAKYGALTLGETVKQAYATIFGQPADDAKAAALLAGRIDYFSGYGRDGASGIGTKAAAVGWLLAEAAKADAGMYAKANDAFLIDLADGTASFSTDLVGTYGKADYAVL